LTCAGIERGAVARGVGRYAAEEAGVVARVAVDLVPVVAFLGALDHGVAASHEFVLA